MQLSERRLPTVCVALAFLIWCPMYSPAAGTQPDIRESQLKALFLYNFAQFAEWPAERFGGPSDPVVIGILGDDPFGGFLEKIIRDEKLGEHPIEIRYFNSAAEAKACHILFIAKNESAHLPQIFEALRNTNILTVSDIRDFTRRGGIVKLFVENNRMRFEVNMKEYQRSKFVLSSRVLRLADTCCE